MGKLSVRSLFSSTIIFNLLFFCTIGLLYVYIWGNYSLCSLFSSFGSVSISVSSVQCVLLMYIMGIISKLLTAIDNAMYCMFFVLNIWLSCSPFIQDYLQTAPKNIIAKQRNGKIKNINIKNLNGSHVILRQQRKQNDSCDLLFTNITLSRYETNIVS